MPTTPIVEANNTTRRMFAYDEMVMASDGTRFYIKYLDGPAPKQAQPSQQRQSTIVGRQSAANSQLMIRNHSVVGSAGRQQATYNVQATTSIPTHTVNQMVNKATTFVQQQVQCGICKQKFKNLPSLNFHIEKAHKDTDGPIDCPCGKRFANKKYMKRHQKRRYETEHVICGRTNQSASSPNQNAVRLTYKNL